MQEKWYSVGEAGQTAHSEALENIKSINRQLLVAAGANIPAQAAHALNQARDLVLFALRGIQPSNRTLSAFEEELPVARFKARAERAERNFDALFQPIRATVRGPKPQSVAAKRTAKTPVLWVPVMGNCT